MRNRVLAKVNGLGERFFAMSESEYGDWLDAMPRDEFIEFITVMIELGATDKAPVN